VEILLAGFNLIGVMGSAGFTAATDQTGTVALAPRPGSWTPNGLQNNGGSDATIAPLPGSPAIDKGTSNIQQACSRPINAAHLIPRKLLDVSSVPNAAGGDGAGRWCIFEFPTIKITSISHLANGHVALQGLGVPNAVHHIQTSPGSKPRQFYRYWNDDRRPEALASCNTMTRVIGLTKDFIVLCFPWPAWQVRAGDIALYLRHL